MVPWVGLCSVSLVFSGHTHLLVMDPGGGGGGRVSGPPPPEKSKKIYRVS